jgi:hypothetical protein
MSTCRVIWLWNLQPCFVFCHTLVRGCTEGYGLPSLFAEEKSIVSGPDSDTSSTPVTSRLCLALRTVTLSRWLSAQYIRPMPEEDNGLRGLTKLEEQRTFISFLILQRSIA